MFHKTNLPNWRMMWQIIYLFLRVGTFFAIFFCQNCYDQHSRSEVKSNCVHCTLLHTHFLYCVAFYQNAIGRMKQNLRENAKFRVRGLFFGESNSHVHEKRLSHLWSPWVIYGSMVQNEVLLQIAFMHKKSSDECLWNWNSNIS